MHWNIGIFSNSEEHPDDLPLRPDGCNLELFEASRHWWASGWKDLVVRTDDALTDERPDGMTRHPDGWQGTEFSDLQTAQNLLEALMNSGIPVKEHHYKEVILSNKMWPTTN
jgi:hypothetical protein